MRILLVLAALAACSSPALRFSGVTPVRQTVGGHVFDVYATGTEAQVIRLNRTWLPDTSEVIGAGVLAAERASGCAVIVGKVEGDAAIMTMPLRC